MKLNIHINFTKLEEKNEIFSVKKPYRHIEDKRATCFLSLNNAKFEKYILQYIHDDKRNK